MPGSQIIQKRLFDRKEITIMQDHLVVLTKSVKEELRYKVKFEELGFETIDRKTKPSGYIFAFILLLDLGSLKGLWDAFYGDAPKDRSVAVISFFILAGITVFMIWRQRQSFIYLTGGKKTVSLFANIPNTLAVEHFIGEIHQAIRHHIRSKYLPFPETMSSEERLDLIEWLKEQNIILEKEYDDLLIDINLDKVISSQEEEE